MAASSLDARRITRGPAIRGTIGWAWNVLGPFLGLLLITGISPS